MVCNFPCIVKTQEVLSLDELVFEIKEGTFIEAALLNGILKYQGEYLVFDGWDDKRAVIPSKMTKDMLKSWIQELIPEETEEEKIDRLRWEQETGLRASSLTFVNIGDVEEDDIEQSFRCS